MMFSQWRPLRNTELDSTPVERAKELFPKHNPVRWVAGIGGVLIAGITLVTILMGYSFRDRALENSSTELSNTVTLFARHFDLHFDQLHKIRKSVTAYLSRNGIASADAFTEQSLSHDTHLMLRAQRGDSETAELALFDTEGDLINSSEVWPAPDLNIAHQDYFRGLKAGWLPDRDIIQSVLRNHGGTGKRMIMFARRVSASDGRFLGIIARYVQPEELERFLASTLQGRDVSIRVYHRDGQLLAAHPATNPSPMSPQQLAIMLALSQSPTLQNVDFGDGQARVGAARELQHYPVTLLATATVDSVLHNWHEQTRFLVVIGILSIIIIAALLYLVIREISDQHLASQKQLTQEKQRLDIAINNMSQGLLLFDSSARMVVANKSYMSMYRLPADIVKPGCHFREIIRQRKLSGTFAGNIDKYCDQVMSNLRGKKVGTQHSVILETADGRSIHVLDGVIPGGGWVATHEDITERRRAEERIAHLAHFDALTDLPNRTLFHTRLEEEIQRVADGKNCAVIYIDIDEFKGINDTLGHTIGDDLLKTIATRLRACVRETDVVARLGGDEFAIVLTDIKKRTEVVRTINRIYESIREPVECQGHRLVSDASIGVALTPLDGTEREELLKNADLAMYSAKADGRRTYRFFKPEMDARVQRRRKLEQDLRAATEACSFADSGFQVFYQPQLSLADNSITGCEALLRWHHPERGLVPPSEFIPVAEEIGVISKLGEWTLRTACADAAQWPSHIKLAVNVSPVQFRAQSLSLKVLGALSAANIAPHRLELEITEAVLIRDDEIALDILHRLREIGVRIALDDFGTGYSSLSYLRRFPFDKIKIDRSFVIGMTDEDSSSPIVKAVVEIAAARKMTTTAEGVETIEQKRMVAELGCTEMQGYLFSAARPAQEILRMLQAHCSKSAPASMQDFKATA